MTGLMCNPGQDLFSQRPQYSLYMADQVAHDVAEDMVDAGLSSVTMIQRNKTCMYKPNNDVDITLTNPTDVLPVEYYQRVADSTFCLDSDSIKLMAYSELQ